MLAEASGVSDARALITPVCFPDPLAPLVASQRAGRAIDWRAIRTAFQALSRRHPLMIVEGIGGLLVPLSDRRTVVDLIRLLCLPIVIVSRLRLGTLNHTLLTVTHAQREGLTVLGVILNASEPPSASSEARLAEATNPDTLRRLLSVPLLGVLPHRRGVAGERGKRAQATLAEWVGTHLDPHFLMRLEARGNGRCSRRMLTGPGNSRQRERPARAGRIDSL